MAYSKLVIAGPDLAIGYQTINQARDNLDSQYEAFKLRHGTIETLGLGGFGQAPPVSVNGLGHHSDERIPRDSVRVTLGLTAGGFVTVTQSASTCLGQGLRSSAGNFAFPVYGLSDFWGHVAPDGVVAVIPFCSTVTSGGTRYIQVLLGDGTAASPLDGIDANFTLTLYGNP